MGKAPGSSVSGKPVMLRGLKTAMAIVGASASLFAAADVSTTLAVGVRVMPVARLTVHGPTTVTLAATDIANGFVDVIAPTQLEVHSNSRSGFVVHIAQVLPLFSTAELHTSAGEVAVDANGGSLVTRWRAGDRATTLAITHRFKLAAGLTPGIYAWPLSYTAEPLTN